MLEEVSVPHEVLQKAEVSETRSRAEYDDLCEYQKILTCLINAKGGNYGECKSL